jgi:hypothetical protein
MKKAFASTLLICLLGGALSAQFVPAQEASSGLDLRATLTAQMTASNELTEAPREGSPVIAGFHSILYPTWKMNGNWFVTGALQLTTRPYSYENFSTAGYGVKGNVLQSTLNYSRVSGNSSVLVRVGEMSTAFGSFMLRYDDADNPLAGLPIGYGYYYSPVSVLGVAGAQVDATKGRWDGRVQFANSSPANPRGLFARDQYGNWAAGAGYTIRQGFRVGVSGYRGPFLDRKYQYFFPGEANPNTLPAHALGADVNWAHGHTSVLGEGQTFAMPYTKIPTFRESVGYVELKRVLSPRWFLALRGGYLAANAGSNERTIETAAGFRVNRLQLLKIGYENNRYSTGAEQNDNVLAIQFVTTLHRAFGRE